jgi:hypothetical protein
MSGFIAVLRHPFKPTIWQLHHLSELIAIPSALKITFIGFDPIELLRWVSEILRSSSASGICKAKRLEKDASTSH